MPMRFMKISRFSITLSQVFITHLHIKLSDSFDNFKCSAKLYSTPVCLCLQAVHLAQASFQIEAFGSKFILDLTLNK